MMKVPNYQGRNRSSGNRSPNKRSRYLVIGFQMAPFDIVCHSRSFKHGNEAKDEPKHCTKYPCRSTEDHLWRSSAGEKTQGYGFCNQTDLRDRQDNPR
jgi:hypothetical protein